MKTCSPLTAWCNEPVQSSAAEFNRPQFFGYEICKSEALLVNGTCQRPAKVRLSPGDRDARCWHAARVPESGMDTPWEYWRASLPEALTLISEGMH
jgi:hypothetical protein